MLESALEGELVAEGGRESYRIGHRAKTVVAKAGPVEFTAPATGLARLSLPAEAVRWGCRSEAVPPKRRWAKATSRASVAASGAT